MATASVNRGVSKATEAGGADEGVRKRAGSNPSHAEKAANKIVNKPGHAESAQRRMATSRSRAEKIRSKSAISPNRGAEVVGDEVAAGEVVAVVNETTAVASEMKTTVIGVENAVESKSGPPSVNPSWTTVTSQKCKK